MTRTKLQILSEYTPDHPGPFCTREKVPVELMYRNGRGNYPLGGYIGDSKVVSSWANDGAYYTDDQCNNPDDLMNAVEVPVAREFWVNEYSTRFGFPHSTPELAAGYGGDRENFIRTVHVREVLPGESE